MYYLDIDQYSHAIFFQIVLYIFKLIETYMHLLMVMMACNTALHKSLETEEIQ